VDGRVFPIGTVAKRYGVPPSTLRYWEDIGILPAQRRHGGQGRYDIDALRRIKFIRMAKQLGLSLDAIRTLLARHSAGGPNFDDWAKVAREQLAVIDQRVDALHTLKATIEECLACGCQHPRRCKLLNVLPMQP